MSACRSCGAPIKWVRSMKTNKAIPLDPEPVLGGNIDVDEVGGSTGPEPVAIYAKPDPTIERHVSHFATCPNAKEHRKS